MSPVNLVEMRKLKEMRSPDLNGTVPARRTQLQAHGIRVVCEAGARGLAAQQMDGTQDPCLPVAWATSLLSQRVGLLLPSWALKGPASLAAGPCEASHCHCISCLAPYPC